MNNLIPIEFKEQRVLTTQQLAEAYEADPKNIHMNFSNNKERFVEGRDFYFLQGETLQGFKQSLPNDIGEPLKFAPQLYLWTERGANRHCKILDADRAWQQFDILEETYFKVKQNILNPYAGLSKELQAIFTIDKVQQEHEQRITHLENNMTLEHGQEVTVKKEVDNQVRKSCFGNESPAYLNKQIRSKVYRALWRDYKDYFNITSYHDTLKKDLETALTFIKSWKPTGSLLREIQMNNSQMQI